MRRRHGRPRARIRRSTRIAASRPASAAASRASPPRPRTSSRARRPARASVPTAAMRTTKACGEGWPRDGRRICIVSRTAAQRRRTTPRGSSDRPPTRPPDPHPSPDPPTTAPPSPGSARRSTPETCTTATGAVARGGSGSPTRPHRPIVSWPPRPRTTPSVRAGTGPLSARRPRWAANTASAIRARSSSARCARRPRGRRARTRRPTQRARRRSCRTPGATRSRRTVRTPAPTALDDRAAPGYPSAPSW